MPNLYVLLSTFNGETYLEELLQSVIQQSYSHFELRIRDDGSVDNTTEILRKYAALDSRIVIDLGSNIGVQASFYSLLECVEDATGFFAFCDQDDIWGEEKLEIAMQAIADSARPEAALYFSRLSGVDANNDFLYDTDHPRAPGIFNALVENSAIGCTCVFGHTLRADFLRGNPSHMIMHDWWLYLCAASRGELLYDEVPRIRYRQHENTATPREPGTLRLKNRFMGLLGRIWIHDAGLESLVQARHFFSTYPDCHPEIGSALEFLDSSRGIANLIKRADFVLGTGLHRNSRLETIALKLVIIFDLY
jgi:glycosyltransferase involved in cell wall biosynthesis